MPSTLQTLLFISSVCNSSVPLSTHIIVKRTNRRILLYLVAMKSQSFDPVSLKLFSRVSAFCVWAYVGCSAKLLNNLLLFVEKPVHLDFITASCKRKAGLGEIEEKNNMAISYNLMKTTIMVDSTLCEESPSSQILYQHV